MTTVAYSDSRIAKIGRWQDTGTGIWSGWGGSQLKFKISGVTSFTVNASVVCATGKLCACECVIDNNPADSLLQNFANNENFTGARAVTFSLPSTGMHDIILKTNGYNADIFGGSSKSVVTGIDIGSGTMSAPSLGVKTVQCVGDSWMAADCDWPRLIDPLLWSVYQIGTGGLTAANMDTQYNYASSGVTATDIAADAVIVSFGVNDFNNGISVSSFQTSLLSIVDKIQARQSCPIFLIQVPRNLSTGKTFDQYGAAMQNITGLRSNVNYISTANLWSSLTWNADTYHLSPAGKVVMANFIDAQLNLSLGITKNSIRVGGNAISCDSTLTDRHWLRIGGLGVNTPPNWLKISS